MADERYEMGGLSFVVRPAKGAPGEGDQPLGLDAPRDGVLYLPETAEPGAPLLIFLHGVMGAGHAHLRAALAAVDRYGVILVAPDSRGPTWDLIAEGRFGPDVACLDRVLDALADRVDADTERLAIGGVSDGASYALSIGLTNGDVFPTVPAYRPAFWSCPTARTARLPIRRLDDNVAAARMGAGCEERAGDAEARLGQSFAD